MGRDKAWLQFDGRQLIERAIATVQRAGADELWVSGRSDQDFSSISCPLLTDIHPDRGPLGGIERALNVAKHPLVLVLAVDLPRMNSDFLSRLVGECTGHRGAIPILRGGPEPLAAIYPREAYEVVRSMLAENELAVRDFAHTCLRKGLAIEVIVPEQCSELFENWNSPGDVT